MCGGTFMPWGRFSTRCWSACRRIATTTPWSKIDAASELEERLARYRHAIRAAPPPSEHRRVPGVDRALAEIIDRCLAVNPDDRFANVQEVLDALAARKLNRSGCR